MMFDFYTRKAKYGNKITEVNGHKFDSNKEANRYKELLIMEKAGYIKELELQKKFELIPNQKIGKKVVERAVNYVADFYYYDNLGKKYCVEDTKGFRTPDYIIKRKLMLWVHGIKIIEI